MDAEDYKYEFRNAIDRGISGPSTFLYATLGDALATLKFVLIKFPLASFAFLAVGLCSSFAPSASLAVRLLFFLSVLRVLGGEAVFFLGVLRGLSGEAFILP